MPTTALDGLRIVELASFVAGPYCGKLLADMGAEVIKVEEPPSGDEARRYGPFPGDLPHSEKSGLFLYLNTNKVGVTLNVRNAAGYDILIELLRDADVFIHDRSAAEAVGLGLDYDTLRGINPQLIVTVVTPFGLTGPYAEYRARDLNLVQVGAEGYMLPGGLGRELFPNNPPIKLGGHAGDYDGGSSAAVGTMAAVMARELWGTGQLVDASRQEANLALNRVAFVTYLTEGKVPRRANRRYAYGGLYPTSDGYIAIRPTENNHWKALAEAMGQPALADDERFKDRTARGQNGAELDAIVAAWSGERTKAEIFDACFQRGCPVAPFASAEEIAHAPQLAARGYFVEVDHPQAGAWPYPSAPYQFSETPWSARSPAPLLGQHNARVLTGRLGFAGEDLTTLRATGAM